MKCWRYVAAKAQVTLLRMVANCTQLQAVFVTGSIPPYPGEATS